MNNNIIHSLIPRCFTNTMRMQTMKPKNLEFLEETQNLGGNRDFGRN